MLVWRWKNGTIPPLASAQVGLVPAVPCWAAVPGSLAGKQGCNHGSSSTSLHFGCILGGFWLHFGWILGGFWHPVVAAASLPQPPAAAQSWGHPSLHSGKLKLAWIQIKLPWIHISLQSPTRDPSALGCSSSGNSDYSSLEIGIIKIRCSLQWASFHWIPNPVFTQELCLGMQPMEFPPWVTLIWNILLNQHFPQSSYPPALSTSRGKRELNLNSALCFVFYPLHKALPSSLNNAHPRGLWDTGKAAPGRFRAGNPYQGSLSRLLISLVNSRSMQHLIRLLKEGLCLTPHQQHEKEKFPSKVSPGFLLLLKPALSREEMLRVQLKITFLAP